MPSYLITGGSGFLGAHLARELLKRGAKVRTLDLSPFDEPDVKGQVESFVGDIRDEKGLKRAADGVDQIIHAAAALPLASWDDIFSTNVSGTEHVLRVAKQQGISRVVVVSSTAVYGIPKKHPIFEHDEKIGVGAYGQSKILAEQVVSYFRHQGLCIPIIRPKTFIGTGRLGVFQILFDWISKGARIPMIGNGNNRYQLLDVADLVSGILLLCDGEAQVVNDDFNVGASEFQTVREDLTALCLAAGTGSRVLSTPAKPIRVILKVLEKMRLSPLYQWVYDTADKDSFVSTEKISSTLGWKPQYSNQASLRRTYEWYRENAGRYEGLYGTTHRVFWKQGALTLARKILGG